MVEEADPQLEKFPVYLVKFSGQENLPVYPGTREQSSSFSK
jgi:hypothetical protein